MVVETMLACEGGVTDETYKWFDASMTAVVVHQGGCSCECLVFTDLTNQ